MEMTIADRDYYFKRLSEMIEEVSEARKRQAAEARRK